MLEENPTDVDIETVEPVEDDVAITPVENDDFWNEDDNYVDERYAGNGIPSWSAWAE